MISVFKIMFPSFFSASSNSTSLFTTWYVFVAFSGETYEEGSKLPQEIIVFSHEGKIIKRLRLNEEFMIGKFSVKEDMIYAYGNGKLISFNWKNAMSL